MLEAGAGEVTRWVRCGGERVACRLLPGRRGYAGVPLLALHGLGSDSVDLLPVACRSGAPSALVDLPGFGASDHPDRDYPVARAVEAALRVLDHLGLERAVWLGCSYGGHVALRAALTAPARVAGLVLVSSGGLSRVRPLHLAPAFAEATLAARSVEQVAAALRRLAVRPTDLVRDFQARRLARHGAGDADYRAVGRSAVGALRDPTGERLEEIAAPVALVHGDADVLVPLSAAREAARRLRHATLTVLPGTGHLAWLEDPDSVAACTDRALARTRPQRISEQALRTRSSPMSKKDPHRAADLGSSDERPFDPFALWESATTSFRDTWEKVAGRFWDSAVRDSRTLGAMGGMLHGLASVKTRTDRALEDHWSRWRLPSAADTERIYERLGEILGRLEELEAGRSDDRGQAERPAAETIHA